MISCQFQTMQLPQMVSKMQPFSFPISLAAPATQPLKWYKTNQNTRRKQQVMDKFVELTSLESGAID